MKKIALLLAVCLTAVAARAIELSLEENRGERGSVGYVDIQRLFADSPDAQRAKEGFEDMVRQAEERVNLRKAELLKLHHELDAARADRDALAAEMTSTGTASGVASSTAAAVAVSTPAAAAPIVAVSTPAAAVPAVAVSTPAVEAPPPHHPRALALPGMSTMDTTAIAAPAVSTAAAAVAVSSAPSSVPAVAVSSAPAASAASSVVTSTGMAAAAAMLVPSSKSAAVVQAPPPPSAAQHLLEYDARIIKIQAEIAEKETALTREHDDADHGLLDLESRKTDQVLARLYRAVSEVARREGVSVVIDKASILFGQPAVDLTDKVFKYLKENPQQ